MSDARWDEDTLVIMGSITAASEIYGEGRSVRWGANPKIVQDDSSSPERHVPVISLVEVIVQSDNGSAPPVAAVSLDHLPAVWEPLASIGLDEETARVAMNNGLHYVNARDYIGLRDFGHCGGYSRSTFE